MRLRPNKSSRLYVYGFDTVFEYTPALSAFFYLNFIEMKIV